MSSCSCTFTSSPGNSHFSAALWCFLCPAEWQHGFSPNLFALCFLISLSYKRSQDSLHSFQIYSYFLFLWHSRSRLALISTSVTASKEQCCTLMVVIIAQHTHAEQAVRNAGFHALSAVTKHLVTEKKMSHSKLMTFMISYNSFQAKQIPLEEYNRLSVGLNQLRF